MMSEYQKIQSQIAELQKRAEALLAADRSDAIKTIVELIAAFRLTARDIGLTRSNATGSAAEKSVSKAAPSRRPKVPAKFSDSQGNAWSGRGLQPTWMRKALAEGASLDSFRVAK